MESYKEKLRLHNIIYAFACAVLAIVTVLALAGETGILPAFVPSVDDSHWQSTWRGFITGASFGALAKMLFNLIRNLLTLRDEKKLKKLYIKTNDERTLQVCTSAQVASMTVFLILGIVAVVVSGYFSATVSLTILCCVCSTSLITLLFKLYYRKKF